MTVEQGAAPWVATFNVPSWVQGTNSAITGGNARIERTYYTCNVEGGAFSGNMRLVKQGDGTLNLPKVEQAYTGNTDIWAGTVNFDGTMLKTSLWLNRFTTLNSDGGQFRRIKMDYGSTLQPGRADQRGSITTDSLLLGFGARLVIDLYDNFEADQVNTRLLTIETKDWKYGPEYLTPIIEFANHAQDLAAGRYLIGTATEINGNLADIRIEGLDTKKKSSLVSEDGKLYLEVAVMRGNTDIYWAGTESDTWDLGETPNFLLATGEQDAFVSGDRVIFNDNATQFNVNIPADIEADSIIVDNDSNPYIFKGTGAITGATTLVKRGNSTLTISTDNNYTGGTRISGGSVIVSSLANVNQPKGNLGTSSVLANKFVIENGAELRTTAAVTNGSAMQVLGEEGGVINNLNDFIVDRAISGTVLNKKGSGWMKLNVSNTALNRLIVSAGTVQCVNANMPAQTVEFQNGTLSENTSSSYNIYVPKDKRGTWNLVDRATYKNKVTGNGSLTVYCPVVVLSSGNATRCQLAGNWSEFEGTITCKVHSSDTRFTLDNSYGMPKATLNVPAGVEVQNSGKSFHIGRISGTGSLGGTCSFSQSGGGGANTWQVGNETDFTWGGKVTSNANFYKVGTGTITYQGSSDNTGVFTISEGTMLLKSGIMGKGRLVVSKDGTLMGTNTDSKALNNSSVTVSGTVHPGNTATSYMGVIYFGNKAVTFNEGSVLEVTARQCATASNPGCTSIAGISTLTMNGLVRVGVANNHTLQAGDSIRIWSASTMTGTPTLELPAGIEWDTTRIAEGLLFVKSVSDGIESIRFADNTPADIYDLNGRLVRKNADSTEGLPSGIYIRRGKKIVVK